MKKYQLSFIFAGLITIFTACSKEPMDMAFIVNETDNPIMLYSEIDSLPVPPHKKIFYSGIVVEDEGIVSWSDIQFDFVGSRTLTKIGIAKDNTIYIYDVPEQYTSVLRNPNNYLHHFNIKSGKYISSHYEFFLRDSFVNEIVESNEKR